MTDMTPTNRLRWIDRIIGHFVASERVLQQWWQDVQTGDGEWRDVPLEQDT